MAKSINLNEIKKALSFADEIKEFNTVKGEFVKSLKDGFSEIKKSADYSKKSILGGLGIGSMMTAAVAALMATPDLKEPMANLKASLEGVFT